MRTNVGEICRKFSIIYAFVNEKDHALGYHLNDTNINIFITLSKSSCLSVWFNWIPFLDQEKKSIILTTNLSQPILRDRHGTTVVTTLGGAPPPLSPRVVAMLTNTWDETVLNRIHKFKIYKNWNAKITQGKQHYHNLTIKFHETYYS